MTHPQDEPQSPHSDRKAGHEDFPFSDPPSQQEYDELNKSTLDLKKSNQVFKRASKLPVSESSKSTSNSWARYSSLGLEMAATLILPILGGLWLDKHYDMKPWGVVAGAGLGLPASVYLVIAAATRMNRDNDEAKARRAKSASATGAPKQLSEASHDAAHSESEASGEGSES